MQRHKVKLLVEFDLTYGDEYTLDKTSITDFKRQMKNYISEVSEFYVHTHDDDSYARPVNIEVKNG